MTWVQRSQIDTSYRECPFPCTDVSTITGNAGCAFRATAPFIQGIRFPDTAISPDAEIVRRAQMLFSGTLLISRVPFRDPAPAAPSAPLPSIGAKVARIRSSLSLNVSQLAGVMRTKRPTIYSWIDGARPQSRRGARLQEVYSLALEWDCRSSIPLGDLRSVAGEDGQSTLDLLKAKTIDKERILRLFENAAETLRITPEGFKGLGLKARGMAEPPDAQRQIDRASGKRISPE